jgi:predicted dehydrogenase
MDQSKSNRRDFMKTTTTAAVAAGTVFGIGASRVGAETNSETLKLGLVGCGGRGGGAVIDALKADANVKLVAMADVFEDRLTEKLNDLQGSEFGDRVDVPEDRRYVGFDAYKNVIDQVDVVVLAATPHFRPMTIEYAVEKGVHIFAEKPVATDAIGVRRVLAACQKAKEKNLSVVSGLCWRYHIPRVETMKRVLNGDIGEIVSIETTYNSGGVWPPRKRRSECNSDMEYQIRNWYYYTWLSGDHINEQAIHGIDTMAWAMGDEPPVQCWGVGGRQVRTEEMWGNIWDHFSIVYEYANGVHGYHQCRHWKDTPSRVKDFVMGTKGTADVFANSISGPNSWKYESEEKHDMYQHEHEVLFASIRNNEPVNDGERMCRSTLLAIMGRDAAYTGDVITWEQALNSEQSLAPAKYEWGEAPKVVIAVPGKTKIA